MSLVWKQEMEPITKLTLMALADCADDKGFDCWPSVKHLAEKVGVSDSTIRRKIKELTESGYLQVQSKSREDGSQTSNYYRLWIDPDQVLAKHKKDNMTPPPVTTDSPPLSQVTDHEPISEPIIKKKNYMSGKPDGADLKSQAIEVLEFLNKKTGRSFRPYEAGGKPTMGLERIMARIKAGASVLDCRGVIARKARIWKDDERMSQYLRPKTLFARENFENYLGEQAPPDDDEPVS